MTTDARATTLAPLAQPRRGRGPLARFAVRQPLATFGLLVLIFFVVLAIVAPYVVPKDPLETSIITSRKPPGSEYWFGSDNLGRDIFSRVILATRFSILLGLAATL